MARVFLVDDSRTSRAFLRRVLEQRGHAVVGEAGSGVQALRDVPAARPDIVLMDVVMGGLDGIRTSEQLLAAFPVPILIVSDLADRDTDLSFRALAAGALDVFRKPGPDAGDLDELARRVGLLAQVPIVTRRPRRTADPRPTTRAQRVGLLAIGVSTGGPPLILDLITAFPKPPPWPTLIVQHMAMGFTKGFADWLRRMSHQDVVLATDGVRPLAGRFYIAPEDRHLVIERGHLRLRDAPPVNGFRPSVDVLFGSVATSEYAKSCLAVLLTGMGTDGADGLGQLRTAGAMTMAQDQASSAVFGMPRAAIERGAAGEVISAADLRTRLVFHSQVVTA